MRRPILCGIFICVLSAGICGTAQADQTAPTFESKAVRIATASVPSVDPGAPASGESGVAESGEAGPPVALTAANVTPVRDAVSTATVTAEAPVAEPAKHINRLRRFASGIVSRSSAIASSLTRSAMRFIGTPYVFGGTRATGFDCSGYVQHVFALLGVHLPRTADAQFGAGHRISAAIATGDLVFFHTYAPGVSHVGIYIGNSKFIHSSSSRGVAVSSLHDRYWAPRYLGAKRVFGS